MLDLPLQPGAAPLEPAGLDQVCDLLTDELAAAPELSAAALIRSPDHSLLDVTSLGYQPSLTFLEAMARCYGGVALLERPAPGGGVLVSVRVQRGAYRFAAQRCSLTGRHGLRALRRELLELALPASLRAEATGHAIAWHTSPLSTWPLREAAETLAPGRGAELMACAPAVTLLALANWLAENPDGLGVQVRVDEALGAR